MVEVLSDSTRRRDLGPKRAFYMEDVRVPEYWTVDPEAGTIRVVRPEHEDALVAETLTWQPAGAAGASEPRTFALKELFATGR